MSIQRIIHLIEISGITAKELTERASLSHSAITEWKKGKAKPSAEALVKIAKYFEVPIEYLLKMGVFENWEEFQNEEALDAVSIAFCKDFEGKCLSTGENMIGLRYRAIFNGELERIRFFSWAVKSVKIESGYRDWEEILVANIEYTDVFKMMISNEDHVGEMKRTTYPELLMDSTKRRKILYDHLEEDERQLLELYWTLSDVQKGEVFKTINSFNHRPYA